MSYRPVTWKIARIHDLPPRSWGIRGNPVFYSWVKAGEAATNFIRQKDWRHCGVGRDADGELRVSYVLESSEGEKLENRVFIASLNKGILWEIGAMWDAKQDWFEAFPVTAIFRVWNCETRKEAIREAFEMAKQIVASGYTGFGKVNLNVSTTDASKSLEIFINEEEVVEALRAEAQEEIEP